ncbi:hypothetical protein [Legionella septentrionalis]|uniref:hypothetical protein n=1 Tax=Legionella septentrionalis TaxID=2498109 RepID=UPI000F8EF376|nr:hypothetical protein [Legionella septentrionalis]RUR09042.1 hypothetical protein ELY14_09980 [Legionella septentrionalis]
MKNSIYEIKQTAFLPTQSVEINKEDLDIAVTQLYEQIPCYSYNRTEHETYKKQLSTLIDELAKVVLDSADLDYRLDVEDIKNQIALLKIKLADTSYVDENPQVQAAYFLAYKKNLETIYFLIQDWDINKKRQFVLNLGERVMVCATGAHTQLCEIVYELTQKPSVATWLAELRKNIVNEFAETWVAKYAIPDGSSIHVHFFCAEHAKAKGWEIPGHAEIRGYSDDRFKPRSLNEGTKGELTRFFESRYTAKTIINNLMVNFNLLLKPYYGTQITPEANENIQSILQPFIEHNLLDLQDIYEYRENGDWLIKENFNQQLQKLIVPLLIKDGLITSSVPSLVTERMIPILEDEIKRLELKYNDEKRIEILEHTKKFLYQTIFNDAIDQAAAISDYIQEVYLNHNLDKYNTLQKIGLVLLNILTVVPLAIPGLIKYATTGTFFFSLCGKTHDMVGDIHQEIIACTA